MYVCCHQTQNILFHNMKRNVNVMPLCCEIRTFVFHALVCVVARWHGKRVPSTPHGTSVHRSQRWRRFHVGMVCSKISDRWTWNACVSFLYGRRLESVTSKPCRFQFKHYSPFRMLVSQMTWATRGIRTHSSSNNNITDCARNVNGIPKNTRCAGICYTHDDINWLVGCCIGRLFRHSVLLSFFAIFRCCSKSSSNDFDFIFILT